MGALVSRNALPDLILHFGPIHARIDLCDWHGTEYVYILMWLIISIKQGDVIYLTVQYRDAFERLSKMMTPMPIDFFFLPVAAWLEMLFSRGRITMDEKNKKMKARHDVY